MFDLTGKTALVTGASGGIGGEIARVLHSAQGATVGAVRHPHRTAGSTWRPNLGDRAHVLPCNLS